LKAFKLNTALPGVGLYSRGVCFGGGGLAAVKGLYAAGRRIPRLQDGFVKIFARAELVPDWRTKPARQIDKLPVGGQYPWLIDSYEL